MLNKMTDSDLARLSALMDGELPEAEFEQVLEQLLSDRDAQQHWANLHQISDGLHERTLDQIPASFSQQVALKIADEPTYIIKRWRRLKLPKNLPLRELAGMAVAASVTAVAILGFQQLHGPVESEMLLAANNSSLPVLSATQKPALPDPLNLASRDFALPVMQVSDPELEAYFVNHQHLGGTTSPVVSPYIRFIGHQPTAE